MRAARGETRGEAGATAASPSLTTTPAMSAGIVIVVGKARKL